MSGTAHGVKEVSFYSAVPRSPGNEIVHQLPAGKASESVGVLPSLQICGFHAPVPSEGYWSACTSSISVIICLGRLLPPKFPRDGYPAQPCFQEKKDWNDLLAAIRKHG